MNFLTPYVMLVHFHIAAGPLSDTLREICHAWANPWQASCFWDQRETDKYSAPAIEGDLTINQAMRAALAGTPLVYTFWQYRDGRPRSIITGLIECAPNDLDDIMVAPPCYPPAMMPPGYVEPPRNVTPIETVVLRLAIHSGGQITLRRIML